MAENLLKREQYYLDLFKPDYNILKKAGSRLGHKLSEETKDKISAAMIGITRSEETKAKLSEANKGAKHPMFGKARPKGSGRPSQKNTSFWY